MILPRFEDLKINCVIGIDPGANGGIAVYVPGSRVNTIKMPSDISELDEIFKTYAGIYRPVVFLEKLSIRHDDMNGGKVFRIQKMIENYAQLKALLDVHKIPYAMVHPMSWQAKLGIRRNHESRDERKRRYRDIAGQWYPTCNVTLWNADALLILHFGRYVLANELNWVLANIPERLHNGLF